MSKYSLVPESLQVESFAPIAEPAEPHPVTEPNPANCICFAPPCVCTNNVDCVTRTQ
jgi:hypothetical protein